MSAMILESQHPEERTGKSERRDVTLSRADKVVGKWSSELGRGYTLYRLLPSVGDLDAVYGLSCEERYIDETTGDTVSEETLYQIGTLDFESVEYPDELNKSIGEVVGLPSFTASTLLHDLTEVFEQQAYEGEYEDINGDVLTVRVSADVIGEDDDLFEKFGDWDTIERVFEVLASHERYPLVDVADKDVYEFQVRLSLSPLWRSTTDLTTPIRNAIDNYLNGVFANKPSMAVIYSVDEHTRLSQSKIADTLGLDDSTVSHQLSSAEEWVNRAHHTSNKYQ